MSATEDHLNRFVAFVHHELRVNQRTPPLAELFDRWQLENPDALAAAEDVLAVHASLDDLRRGECGTPAGEHSRQLRQELEAHGG